MSRHVPRRWFDAKRRFKEWTLTLYELILRFYQGPGRRLNPHGLHMLSRGHEDLEQKRPMLNAGHNDAFQELDRRSPLLSAINAIMIVSRALNQHKSRGQQGFVISYDIQRNALLSTKSYAFVVLRRNLAKFCSPHNNGIIPLQQTSGVATIVWIASLLSDHSGWEWAEAGGEGSYKIPYSTRTRPLRHVCMFMCLSVSPVSTCKYVRKYYVCLPVSPVSIGLCKYHCI